MESGGLELNLKQTQAWFRVIFRCGVRRNPKPRAYVWEGPRATNGVGLPKEGVDFKKKSFLGV